MSKICKKALTSSLVLMTGLLATATQAQASDGSSLTTGLLSVQVKHYLPKAVAVEITPRGQNIFQNQLDTVLSNMGVSIDEAYFSDIKWQSTASYDLDNLSGVNLPPETQQLIATVNDALKSWFLGFPLSDVRPAIEISNSAYQATFNKFAIITDENLLHSLGKTGGAVLVLEVDIKELDLMASKIRAWDQNNPDLGQVGFDDAKIVVAGGQVPLQLRMPFYVSVSPEGIPQFEAVGLDQNIDKTDLQFSHGKIVMPEIELVVNGKVMPFNNAKLETEFIQETPAILLGVRNYLHTFASQQVPALLNQKAKQYLVKALEEVKPLEAPGAPVGSANLLLWGLKLNNINENNGLSVQLDTFVEDASNPNSAPLYGSSATQPAKLNGMNPQDFDIALGLDEGMINRILQLSFERKLFAQVGAGGGTIKPECQSLAQNSAVKGALSLTASPVLKPVSNSNFTDGNLAPKQGETFARLELSVQLPPGTVTGSEKLALKDNFVLNLDLIVRVARSADSSSVGIFLWDVDAKSIKVDPKYMTVIGRNFLQGKIINTIQGILANMTKQWRCQSASIPGSIRVPSVFGMGLGIQNLVMEPTGYLSIYLNYLPNSTTLGVTQ